MGVHKCVHGGRKKDRGTRRKKRRAQPVITDALGRFGKNIRCCRSNHNEICLPCHGDMTDGMTGTGAEHLRNDGIA